jgi:DNA-binding NarL/FixJ family response regulator
LPAHEGAHLSLEYCAIRILLADEHSLFRQALRELLDRESDFEVVAEAGEQAEALAQATKTGADVALIGLDLASGDGIAALRELRELLPECRAVLIADREDADVLLRAVQAGASGYITKSYALADLMATIRAAHRGESIVPPSMLGELIQNLLRRRSYEDEAVERIGRLTRRERQVLTLLAEGGNKETIGRVLFISPETARTHIQHVLAKLGVHSRLEAATLATRGKLLPYADDQVRVGVRLPSADDSSEEVAVPTADDSASPGGTRAPR